MFRYYIRNHTKGKWIVDANNNPIYFPSYRSAKAFTKIQKLTQFAIVSFNLKTKEMKKLYEKAEKNLAES